MDIHEAARRGDKSAFLEILDSTAPDTINAKDKKGCTLLWIACREGHTALVQSLLTHSKFDRTMVKILCESKHRPNLQDGDGETPLSKAAERGNLSMVRLLLDNSSIDVNAKNKD